MNKNTVNKIIEFFNNRNCLIRTNLKGINVNIEYNNGKLTSVFYTETGRNFVKYNSIINIPNEIDFKDKMVFEGVLISTNLEGIYKFVVYDISYIETKYEWEDDVDNEEYTTTNNSSLYNKINCAGFLGFDIVPLTTHTRNVDRTQIAIEKSIEMLNKSCDILGYSIKDHVVLYNDTAWVNMNLNKNVKMTFSK